MKTPFDCTLGGIALSSLDKRLCVLDVREDAPGLELSARTVSGGRHVLRRERSHLTVHILFAIHEEIPGRRSEVLQSVRAWAERGGTLTVSDRPDRQLEVICTALPSLSARDWTEEMTLTFTTTRCPYWEDRAVTSVSGPGTVLLTTPGTADCAPVNAVVTNSTADTVTRLTLQCGSTRMVFDGISLPPDNLFMLLVSNGVLQATINGQSVLGCRTADSDDWLLAPCGRSVTAYASCGQPLQSTFSVRGRYL